MTSSIAKEPTKILIIERSVGNRQTITQSLLKKNKPGYSIKSAFTLQEGVERIFAEKMDCVLLGEPFSYLEKAHMLRAIRQRYPETNPPMIELVSNGGQMAARIFQAEAADYLIRLPKHHHRSHSDTDATADDIQHIIREALRKKYQEESLPQLHIHYREAQKSIHDQENEIQQLRHEIEEGKKLSRLQEHAIQESQAQFRQLCQASFDGIVIHDQGIIVDCNQKMLDTFGLTREEAIGKNFFECFTSDSLNVIRENIRRKYDVPYEVEGIRKDGSLFPGEIAGRPITYNNRTFRLAAIRDITQRKTIDSLLRESEERFRSAFDQAAVGMLHLDVTGRLIRANHKSSEITGYSKEELLHLNVHDLLETKAADDNVLANVQKGEEEETISERICLRQNGSPCWIKLSIARVVSSPKTKPYFVAVLEDIHERKEAELQLKEVNTELNAFVYSTSHDLRGPLASLMGLCSIAQLEVTEPYALEYFNMINQTASQMNNVLNSLLLVNRIKKQEPEKHPVNLNSLSKEVFSSLQPTPGFDKVLFSVEGELENDFHTDPFLLSAILRSALENTIFYQQPYPSKHAFARVIAQPTPAGVRLLIQDNGIGVPPEIINKVFTMFSKGSKLSKGPGLGLYIAKKAVEKLQGSIQLNTSTHGLTELELFIPEMK